MWEEAEKYKTFRKCLRDAWPSNGLGLECTSELRLVHFLNKPKATFEPLGYLLGKARHSGFQSVNKETAVKSCSWLDVLKGSLVKQELGTVIEQVAPSRAKTLAVKEKGALVQPTLSLQKKAPEIPPAFYLFTQLVSCVLSSISTAWKSDSFTEIKQYKYVIFNQSNLF